MHPWLKSFYIGERSLAEIQLLAFGHVNNIDITSEISYIHRSYGFPSEFSIADQGQLLSLGCSLSHFQSEYQDSAVSSASRRKLILDYPFIPDPLILYCIVDLFTAKLSDQERFDLFTRIVRLLIHQFPQRVDLIFQLIESQNAISLLKGLRPISFPTSSLYKNTTCFILHLQSLWINGHYEQLVREYAGYCLLARPLPRSDFLLRSYSMLGLADRVVSLFRDIFNRHRRELSLVTISNMIFAELGNQTLDQSHVAQLVDDYKELSMKSVPTVPSQPITYQRLEVNQKAHVAIISPDLRNHPVGRFWSPIVQNLYKNFLVSHIALNSSSLSVDDTIRSNLKNNSHNWLDVDSSDSPFEVVSSLSPDILIDLGGHTADACPAILNNRIAPVQVTYLGFYGPSYGIHCDWWILDDQIYRRIRDSYPGSEEIWTMPCPSLCFVPHQHGLPEVSSSFYTTSSSLVYGSFNHSRKLTSPTISRISSILSYNKNSSLMFRSHSFFDTQVRRWFLSRFVEEGISASQLLPIPYAATALEGYKDYGRINLHLDTYPVCGTTTTLDSLAMGIPVLTSPNKLYAGSISAAIIEQLGFSEWIAESEDDLPSKAVTIAQNYHSVHSRIQLASFVRNSSICDSENIPRIFGDELVKMLRIKSLSK